MKIFKSFHFFAAIILLTFSTSCVETVVAGSFMTAAVSTREKSLNNTRHDIQIYAILNADFLQNGLKNFGNSIDVTVNEGRVLLTGIARDVQKAKLASDLAWKAYGVKEVIDEIQLRDGDGMHFKDYTGGAYDYFITAKIEGRLFISKKVPTFNYKITTVNKTVYVIGVAHDEAELAKTISLITRIAGVEKVVSHVILINDNRRR